MWIFLAVCSALGLGFYDVMKKISVRDNNVLVVLWLNTLFSALLLSPVMVRMGIEGTAGLEEMPHAHAWVALKSAIVLGSWVMGYFAIKHLPLTIQGPINASRPVLVLIGAMLLFGERLNVMQWAGVALGILSLLLISRLGSREGLGTGGVRWVWLSIGATILGAVSALYDKWLMAHGLRPLEVQSWYSVYQLLLMTMAVGLMMKTTAARKVSFGWRWSIVLISVFLTGADIAYFYALSQPGSMIAVVSMIRRGSVLISFFYGVLALHERHVGAKLVDLAILLVSLCLLVAGSL